MNCQRERMKSVRAAATRSLIIRSSGRQAGVESETVTFRALDIQSSESS